MRRVALALASAVVAALVLDCTGRAPYMVPGLWEEEGMASIDEDIALNRRRLLAWLSASPLLAGSGSAFCADNRAAGIEPITAPTVPVSLITDPKQAINVFDFEPVARNVLPPAHYGYVATGVEDDATLRANREAFGKFQLRPRRLIDVSRVDMSVELFGEKWETPIALAPTGSHKMLFPEGELATARAARARKHLQILSNMSTTAVEAVNEARGVPVWFQLYATNSWEVASALVRRAEAAGCPVLTLTVDRLAGRNIETFERYKRLDSRNCASCHDNGLQQSVKRKPNWDGINLSGLRSLQSSNLSWDFVRRLRDATRMKVVLKGILTAEDARLAVQAGVDGIIVSNHGGRSEENGRGTLEALPEVLEGVSAKLPVLIDSGFRRGTDIIKAMAMGASGICIGRPYLWALAGFGQPGVERVLEILRTELDVAMKQYGVRSLRELNPSFVRRTA